MSEWPPMVSMINLPDEELAEMFFGMGDDQKGRRKGQAERASGGHSPVRHAPASGLIGNSLLTHQAVIKIVRGGQTTGGARLGAQLQYISRDGNLELVNGRNLGGRADSESDELVRDVVTDWERDFERMDRRTKFYTYHLIVSYPASVDQSAARFAAEAFAAKLTGGDYGDRYKYVLAHHHNTVDPHQPNNPHTHIVINRAGEGGRTLHLSRFGVDVQSLRELHVETSRDVGIQLSATSRFSRGVERRSVPLGRIKAATDGRRLPETIRTVQPQHMEQPRYPFYGGQRRRGLSPEVLEKARGRNLKAYEGLLTGLSAAERLSKQRGAVGDTATIKLFQKAVSAAMTQLSQRRELERSDKMDEQLLDGRTDSQQAQAVSAAAQVADPGAEIGKINQDMRVFLDQFAEKIAGMTDEGARTEADIALAKARQQFEPLMDEETRKHFGGFLDRDQGPVARDDVDPVRQRQAAVLEAKDPEVVRPLDERGKTTQARLDDADRAVVQRFEESGMSGQLALQRITSGSDVDRKTRSMWLERDIKSHANTRNLSDDQARTEVLAAYRDAALIYRDAREDIRGINRSFAEGRGYEAEGRAAPGQTTSSRGEDVAGAARSPDADTRSAPVSPPATSPAAQGAPRVSKDYATGFNGTIVETGSALFKPDDPKSRSPYIDLDTGAPEKARVWGVGLTDMLERNELKVGDRARIYSPGSETVKVTETDPKTGEIREKEAQRRRWDADGIERAADRTELKRSVTPEPDRQEPEDPSRVQRRNKEDRGVDR